MNSRKKRKGKPIKKIKFLYKKYLNKERHLTNKVVNKMKLQHKIKYRGQKVIRPSRGVLRSFRPKEILNRGEIKLDDIRGLRRFSVGKNRILPLKKGEFAGVHCIRGGFYIGRALNEKEFLAIYELYKSPPEIKRESLITPFEIKTEYTTPFNLSPQPFETLRKFRKMERPKKIPSVLIDKGQSIAIVSRRRKNKN